LRIADRFFQTSIHMRFSPWLFILFSCCATVAMAQDKESDTVEVSMDEILIQAYALDKPLNDVSASVSSIGTDDLTRFSETNLLPAINTLPGVRMEERSPGSYRFSIRGSLLRSPFGVRNVKVYWNALPFTDGGGNSYLNLVDAAAIGSAEVIKGPAGSLYGAGTGGALMLMSPSFAEGNNGTISLSQVIGSYGLMRSALSSQLTQNKLSLQLIWSHQSSDGYRDNSSMVRDFTNINLSYQLSTKDKLSTSLFYSYLMYGTPGGLTRTQYNAKPTQARPATQFTPGAIQQDAHVENRTPFFGLGYDHKWSSKFSSRLGAVWSTSDFDNPTIRNVEIRREDNLGARLENKFIMGDDDGRKHQIVFGAEFQHFDQDVSVYDNNLGTAGNVQTIDNLTAKQWFIFAQANLELPNDWQLTFGASLNALTYQFSHLSPDPAVRQKRNFSKELSPRAALLKKINENISLYVNYSRGYSPPSLAEVRPSTNSYNSSLKPENGGQTEIGARGSWKSFSFDVAAYKFTLDDAIVIQIRSDGADYFVNSGTTDQAGFESSLSWHPIRDSDQTLTSFKIWNSHAFTDYEFVEYAPNLVDYSGNKLTGVPRNVNTTGIDAQIRSFYANITATYVDQIPLNDANSEYASEYFLLGARVGFKKQFENENVIDLFVGGDNLLDRKYSLGNDLNAAGGRYYNAAARANFYAGVKFTID
jgi:iron complex outermembrane recepter protein